MDDMEQDGPPLAWHEKWIPPAGAAVEAAWEVVLGLPSQLPSILSAVPDMIPWHGRSRQAGKEAGA